jgi:hypothetical protein
MNIRRGLVRIWIVLSALLIIPLALITYQNWVRASHVYGVEVEKHGLRARYRGIARGGAKLGDP